jgi:DNA mismatch repair ATPase MutS
VKRHITTLGELHKELSHITPFAVSYRKSTNIGYMLKCYYQLYSNKTYEHSIRYSVGFGAYMDVLIGINNRLCAGQLGEAKFIDEPRVVFSDQYYPTHSSDICVKNTCDLSQNMIITGVNASGKTTFIKTTAINILFTQQFGVGCYSSCDICPFTHIHSYLNIPDTSGRDSLFQAESRRCKQIIDAIGKNGGSTRERHFVIFDELYSGTNPDEASKAAVSLLRYLSSFNNVRFMLTTHYLKVCKKFRKSGKISNHKMCVKVDSSGGIEYLYKIKKGISKIQGGIEILKMMNYPEEILQDIRDV